MRRNPWSIGALAAMFVLAALFWNRPFLFPVKLFVVFLHEAGHATAAWLTGGSVARIEISRNLGGVCWSSGGWRIVVLSAGYLGSMLFGGLLLLAAARTRWDRALAGALGLAVLGLTAFYVRNPFGLLFGGAFGLALLVSAALLPGRVNDLLLKFLGLTSLMYAVIDIKEDLISRTVPGSDAYQMSRELFLPPVFWGVVWIAVSLAAGVFFVLAASREPARATKK